MRFLIIWLIAIVLGVCFVQYKTTTASGYFPPRIQQICWDNHYGVDWDIAKKQEKRCRVLWTSWTEQIKNGTF